MANYVLAIIKDTKKLNTRCDEVNLKDPTSLADTISIIKDLKDTLRANIDLPALSAPQLGFKSRIFCIKFANGDIRAFINPMIVSVPKKLHLSREVCPSLFDAEYIVPRVDDIEVIYQTPHVESESNKFMGAPAEVFQQMMDLIDGIVLSDIGLEILPGFDQASDEDKEKIIKMYLNSLETRKDILNKEIKANPELKKIDDTIKFVTDVASGKIEYKPLTKEETTHIIEELKKKQVKKNEN
jgi:peptide deformylase